jgi:transcriptional regulator with XRE-family HTH domain
MAASPAIRRRLGAALRSRREELELTQETAAVRCKMSPRYVRAVEAGTSAVSVEALDRLLGALEWSWSDIGEQLSGRSEQSSAARAPESLHRLIDAVWVQPDVRQRELLRRILAAFGRT